MYSFRGEFSGKHPGEHPGELPGVGNITTSGGGG